MSQPQLALAETRSPERTELASCISELAAAEADLDFTQDALAKAQRKKWDAAALVEKLKKEAAEAGDADIAQAVIEATKAGRDISAVTLGAAAAEAPRQLKTAIQEQELYSRAYLQLEHQLPGKQTAVEQCKFKVADAAKAVICASDAYTRICNDLEVLQSEIVRKRVILRFFSSVTLSPSDADKRIEALLMPELPGHPKQPAYTDWESHPSYRVWADALASLITNPDAELPHG